MVVEIGCHKTQKVFDNITVIYNEEAIISTSCIQYEFLVSKRHNFTSIINCHAFVNLKIKMEICKN